MKKQKTEKEPHEKLGDRLKRFRKEAQLTIKQVAGKLDVPASTYRDWESGARILGEPYLILAELYQVSVYELLSGRPPSVGQLNYHIQAIENSLSALKSEVRSLGPDGAPLPN